MIRRFKIEDLIVQDSSGVVFRALDSETGKTVAVRRFFPFGVDGGGLHADEQTAYDIAISRLAGISHPALRSVICGGCDPVDGMPFIATEWVEGHSLLPIVEQGPLPAESAAELITNALEVCELLSQVLAEEAVWVETDVQTIVIGDESSGRRFTFWISPLKWLGSGDEPRGLESIVNLTEEIMGWKGKAVNDQAGRGLGGWLNWLRHAAATTNLHEARESLAASIGAESPASAKKLVTRAAVPTKPLRPSKPVKQSKPKTLLIVNIALALIVAGLGGWVWLRKNPDNAVGRMLFPKMEIPQEQLTEVSAPPVVAKVSPADKSPAAKPSVLPPSPEPAMSEEERRLRANQMAREGIVQDKPVAKPEPPPVQESTAGVFTPDQVGPLLDVAGTEVTLEGELKLFDSSGKSGDGKWLYLVFSNQPVHARGKIIKATAGADLNEAALNSLKGRKIRIKGKVESQSLDRDKRPLILVRERSSITEAP